MLSPETNPPFPKCERTISSAGRKGSEMDTRKLRTKAQRRKIIPGIQKIRAIVKLGRSKLDTVVIREREREDGGQKSTSQWK